MKVEQILLDFNNIFGQKQTVDISPNILFQILLPAEPSDPRIDADNMHVFKTSINKM